MLFCDTHDLVWEIISVSEKRMKNCIVKIINNVFEKWRRWVIYWARSQTFEIITGNKFAARDKCRLIGVMCQIRPLKRGSLSHSTEQFLLNTDWKYHHVVQSFGFNFTPTKGTQMCYLARRKVFPANPCKKVFCPIPEVKRPHPCSKRPLPFQH